MENAIMKKGNSVLMRQMNRRLILNLIKEENTVISRADMARTLGLSRPTVSEIVKSLLEENLLIELGKGEAKHSGGQKPSLLKLNSGAHYLIAADFGTSYHEAKLAITDLSVNIVEQMKLNFGPFGSNDQKDEDRVIDRLIEAIESLMNQAHLNSSDIVGLGIGFPGDIDRDKGVCILSVEFGWQNVPLKDIIQKRLGITTHVENEVRARALAEHEIGIGKGVNNFVYLHVGAGIAAAIIIDGSIYRGTHNDAGEVGHTPVGLKGPLCHCGSHGCLETYASGPAIASRIQKILAGTAKASFSSNFSIPVDSSSDLVYIERLFKAANRKDSIALRLVKELGSYLGWAVAHLVNSFDPGMVILGGYVIESGGRLLSEVIKKEATARIVEIGSRKLTIKRTTLGENAGIIGTAALVRQHLLNFS